MKVYVTKYALTQGVFTAEGELQPNGRCMICPGGMFQSLSKNEWAPDRKAALEQAEFMRQKKVVNLGLEIQRLENLEIEIKE